MNNGQVYDQFNLIHEYANTGQKELMEIPTSESNIVRQMRYIKETLMELEKLVGVKVL